MTSQKRMVLNRRHFLRSSCGSILYLPLLEAMLPWRYTANAAEAASPTRYIVTLYPYGTYEHSLSPKIDGNSWELPDPYKAPLSRHKNDILMIKNLINYHGRWQTGIGDHAKANGCYLTCVELNKSRDNIRAARSMDQYIADRFESQTPHRLLYVFEGGTYGDDNEYGGAYKNLSWRNDTTPELYYTARSLYTKLMDTKIGQNTSGEPGIRDQQNKFIIDKVYADAQRLKAKLGRQDQIKIEEYLSSVHDIQKAYNQIGPQKQCNLSYPQPNDNSIEGRTRDIFKLFKLAMECDLSRVFVFSMGTTNSFIDPENPNSRLSKDHHMAYSHYTMNNSEKDSNIRNLLKVNQAYANMFAGFLDDLKATQEGDKSLLYRTIATFGSGLRDGNTHSDDNLPFLIAGQGNGAVRTGRAIDPGETQTSAVWLALMQSAGVNMESFGSAEAKVSSPLSLK